MRVLVTNPTYRNTTAIVRALGRRDVHVEVIGARNRAGKEIDGQAFHSRYCRARHFARDPRHDLEGFVDDLEAVLREHRFDVLLPVSTNTVIPVSRHADRIRPLAPFPFPDYEQVELAHDKEKMIRFAESVGVGVPRTISVRTGAPLDGQVADLEFPLIVKTRKGAASSGVFRADCRADVERILRRLEDKPLSDPSRECVDSTDPMIQEFIPGQIFDVCIIAREGDVLARVVQCRERTLPVDGGSGTINLTCEQPDVEAEARKLIAALKWTGVGMVEFKLDAHGRPRLMELNPKFWGTLDLSIQAGVNFPYLACLLVTGQEVPRVEYRRGVRYRWMFPDGVRTVQASSDRWHALYDFFWPVRMRTTSEVRFSDLGPSVFALRQLLKK